MQSELIRAWKEKTYNRITIPNDYEGCSMAFLYLYLKTRKEECLIKSLQYKGTPWLQFAQYHIGLDATSIEVAVLLQQIDINYVRQEVYQQKVSLWMPFVRNIEEVVRFVFDHLPYKPKLQVFTSAVNWTYMTQFDIMLLIVVYRNDMDELWQRLINHANVDNVLVPIRNKLVGSSKVIKYLEQQPQNYKIEISYFKSQVSPKKEPLVHVNVEVIYQKKLDKLKQLRPSYQQQPAVKAESVSKAIHIPQRYLDYLVKIRESRR